MGNFTNEKIKTAWESAKKVDGYDASKYRQDLAGAWIEWDKYGTDGTLGWEVDHAFPQSMGGTDHNDNIRAMNWANNRTKADNFPSYKTSVGSEGNRNAGKEQSWTFTETFIARLKQLYPNNANLKKAIA